jgi:hypothetical protein
VVARLRDRGMYLVHSNSARQTASDRRISDVASSGRALTTVLAEDILGQLFVSALLAALDVVSCMLKSMRRMPAYQLG